jgi:archaellum component FlaG (FlaF/FlaG flagellin family)
MSENPVISKTSITVSLTCSSFMPPFALQTTLLFRDKSVSGFIPNLSIENKSIIIFILAQHTDKRLTFFTKQDAASVYLPPGNMLRFSIVLIGHGQKTEEYRSITAIVGNRPTEVSSICR